MWAVVVFDEEEATAAVPITWVSEGKCCWPGAKNRSRLIQQCVMPAPSWPQFPCRVLQISGDYEKARKLAWKAEKSSDLEQPSDLELNDGETRKSTRIKKTPVFSDNEDDDESWQSFEVPPSPWRKHSLESPLVSSSASHQLPPPPPHPFDATSKHLQQGSSGLHHSFSQSHISSEQHQSSSLLLHLLRKMQKGWVALEYPFCDWTVSRSGKCFRTLHNRGEHVSGLSREVKKLRKTLGSPVELSPQLTDIQLSEDLPTFPLDSEDDLRQWNENLKRKELKTNLQAIQLHPSNFPLLHVIIDSVLQMNKIFKSEDIFKALSDEFRYAPGHLGGGGWLQDMKVKEVRVICFAQFWALGEKETKFTDAKLDERKARLLHAARSDVHPARHFLWESVLSLDFRGLKHQCFPMNENDSILGQIIQLFRNTSTLVLKKSLGHSAMSATRAVISLPASMADGSNLDNWSGRQHLHVAAKRGLLSELTSTMLQCTLLSSSDLSLLGSQSF
ncbi:unnamed protein product [Darwinula stevensoni]|uniref:Uncharacterized protein n=1 Tax=Darwinula stevensoni TaxID=69355 RepID=A0A7R9A4A1_9CRUS|nr:unnamed protein product [Darwinula stevensoni]CAG0889561.1 unnamed protein product [Darwinula stevensoni]